MNRILKRAVCTIYAALIVVMAATTVVENVKGTAFAHLYFYGSQWFMLLWGLLSALGIAYLLKRRMKRWGLLALHGALVVILLGALLTHLTSYKGTVHIRGDQPTNQYTAMMAAHEDESHTLPFYVRLDRFDIVNHNGTRAAADYVTRFAIIDGAKTIHAQVSMNRIYTYRGVRFYQASYDTDNQGSYLSVNSDPWGVPVTYTGYALLFVSLVWLLLDPKGTFRQLLNSPMLKKGMLAPVILMAWGGQASGATLLPQETAHCFGELLINYNDRICPMQTFAYDFTKKIWGKTSYHGATPEQVLMSWIFYPQEWCDEPIVRLKSNELRQHFGLPRHTSVNAFFRDGSYILGPMVAEYAQGNQDALHKACAEVDATLQVVMSLRDGSALAIFPHTSRTGHTEWFAPSDTCLKDVPKADALFFKNLFPLIAGELRQGNIQTVDTILGKVSIYQRAHAGTTLPGNLRIKAEYLYNSIPFTTILFMANLTLGFTALLGMLRHMTANGKRRQRLSHDNMRVLLMVCLAASLLVLTFTLALRWTISGNIPLANGYESMLSIAWFAMLVTLVFSLLCKWYSTLACTFGFLLSGLALLVSHIGQMNPAIGPMMPVLNSPLLSLHVSIIMMSYALLALTFICSLSGLLAKSHAKELRMLSGIFLYPAITTLGLGIFIGAIWANISWGTYWSWDPKETWALITLMVYAIPLHTQSLAFLGSDRRFHGYMTCAFLAVVITYFGVNYILGGMHSYA